jgi:hypothetical protein|tara:strand:- start:942 stop:1079 length:138 start_codon:yes stop_codon:yes gene_type:complete
MSKKKQKPKKTKKIKEKQHTDHYGLGEAFMRLSDFLFGKGWNKTK